MTQQKLLLIVDDWELLERYEEQLSHEFEVFCAPFGPEGIQIARETAPDAILLHLTFENMTNREARDILSGDPLTRDISILEISDEPISSSEIIAFLKHSRAPFS
jgi:CheY-like chemotaxis protein